MPSAKYMIDYARHNIGSVVLELYWPAAQSHQDLVISLVPRPLPVIKMCAGRGSGGMTRFLTVRWNLNNFIVGMS